MKVMNLLLLLMLSALLTACGGGGGDSSSPTAPVPVPEPEPAPTGFDYSFEGAAVKGVISGGGVSVVDAEGNPVGVTTVTDSNGGYTISFTSDTELLTPLLIIVDGSSATVVCDLRPSCDPGAGPDGPLDPVPFGETYLLPEGFELRAAISSVETSEDGTTTATAFVSPLSEFVVDAALSLAEDGPLTGGSLDVANGQVADLIEAAFPSVTIPDGVDIATIPLVDVTNLENADLSDASELSLVVSSVNAAVIGFVDADDEERADIGLVVEDLSNSISENTAAGGDESLEPTVEVALIEEAVKSLDETVTELEELEQSGAITLPDTVVIEELEEITVVASEAQPDFSRLSTSLTALQVVSPVQSGRVGSAQLLYLSETGEAEAIVNTGGVNATAVHFHEGFMAQPGPILIELERNSQGGWEFPENTVLDQGALNALAKGGTYFDVHSSAFPDGELRGQLLPSGISTYFVTPNGAEQTPLPTASTAFARAAITLDNTTNLAQVHVTVADLNLREASLRRGSPGASGPVVVNTEPEGLNNQHWFSSDVPFAGLIDDLNAAKIYFNLGTPQNTSGELRGQILPAGFQVTSAPLEAAQVVAEESVKSDASGTVVVTSNAAAQTLTAHSNLFGVSTPLRVFMGNGPSAEDGEIVFDLAPDSLFQFAPQSSGASHWFVDSRVLSSADFQSFQAGQFYVQASTAAFPEGELRGQLGSVVPIDSDGDGVANSEDAFPNDPDETKDTDSDGVGDNADAFPEDPDETKDTDEDSVGDNADAFPQDPTETKDSDGDGVGDNADAFPNDPDETRDSDGDGTGDVADQCPADPSGIIDSNNDGVCDDGTLGDADGDGVPDLEDAFPEDPDETTDTDGDGVGDNADAFPEDDTETADTDGDGVGDNADAFPENPAETTDSDGDGVGNNADVFPTNASESADTDGDGVGDNADAFPTDATEILDSDGDGVGNNSDAFPNDPNESVDADNDGIGDNADNCVVTTDPDNPEADGDGFVRDCSEVVSFELVQEIFDTHCVECHGTSGGLDLSRGVSFSQLVNVPSQDIPELDRVEPRDSDRSYLVWKLEGRDGILGSIQPPSGRLGQSDIDLIKAWIDGGAQQ